MPPSPASPALRELLRDLKDDFELAEGGGGHFQIVWKKTGEPLRAEGGLPVMVPSTPRRSGHSFENVRQQLRKAGALRSNGTTTRTRERTPDTQLRIERGWATRAGEDRVKATKALRDRLEPLLAKAGGLDRVKPGDMARIASKVHGEWPLDSALTTVGYFLAGRALSEQEIEHLSKLADHLETVADARQEWFTLLREVLGLQAETHPGGKWPFTVKTLTLNKLFADFDYQRPVQESFVRDMVLRFDERLVGVLNVSDRGNDSYAVIDGLQRMTAMSRLGKTAAFCCIHTGLSIGDEAALFYHHNRDRKPVHPYYDFRARVVAGDPIAKEIKRIAEEQGFVISSTTQSKVPGERERNLAAIRSLEEIFGYFTEVRDECLTPTLSVIWRNWLGRPYATEATIMRGLGRFFRTFSDDEIQWVRWEDRLAAMGPQLVLGRASDLSRYQARATMVAQVLTEIHNDAVPRGQRLDPRAVMPQRKLPQRME